MHYPKAAQMKYLLKVHTICFHYIETHRTAVILAIEIMLLTQLLPDFDTCLSF